MLASWFPLNQKGPHLLVVLKGQPTLEIIPVRKLMLKNTSQIQFKNKLSQHSGPIFSIIFTLFQYLLRTQWGGKRTGGDMDFFCEKREGVKIASSKEEAHVRYQIFALQQFENFPFILYFCLTRNLTSEWFQIPKVMMNYCLWTVCKFRF